MNKILILFLVIFVFTEVKAQSDFSLEIEETSSLTIPPVHSFTHASWNDKLIIIGGRVNGLHGFLPPFAFPGSGINNNITVIDTATNISYTADINTLSQNIKEAIRVSNMQYYQVDSMLYMIGGYGYNDSISNFITYPTLTAINIKGLSNSVINNLPIDNYFRQIINQDLAVCGTTIGKIGDTYQLVFGHRFDGTYSVNDTAGFFQQDYTYGVRRFNINDDGINLSISNYSNITDTAEFRRRDYNLVSQIFPNGEFGYTAFSGVFKKNTVLPYTYPVNITATDTSIDENFNQLLSQYHSAHLPLFDAKTKTMNTIFFGGMAMYYSDTTGQVVYDSLVPFVPTISLVSRDSLGVLTEEEFSVKFPLLLGTNAEFIPAKDITLLHDDIILLDSIQGKQLVGYIIGGIESPEKNISASDASVSSASQHVFKVYIINNDTATFTHQFNKIQAPYSINVIPNPANEKINFHFDSEFNFDARISLYSISGIEVFNSIIKVKRGKSITQFNSKQLEPGLYYYKVTGNKFMRSGSINVTH
jgi:hypothetical protein